MKLFWLMKNFGGVSRACIVYEPKYYKTKI
jgi:hypothetical protein